ncbi:hypothetical protein OIU85_015119 [Salix viminalis]|uniref:CCHC-type domain-containing protein n=1 Tax=Salix viminalis TaxID=40686 RepID=A0A9Q0NKC8_SALVM|nr:hypothetical protein OIU85_015119 [Salix viminalis]
MELLAKNLVVVALVMAFALVSKPIAARGQATLCGMTAEGFDFCKPSVQTGVNPLPPSQSCCSALEKANLGCLCFFKKNYPKVLSENKIDPNLAMQLPAKCNMPGPAVLGLTSPVTCQRVPHFTCRSLQSTSQFISSLLPSAPLLLFSLVPSSPTSSLLFVVAGLLQMACESHEYNGGDPFSSTPSQPSLSTSPSPKKNPKENDQCFTCKRLGHWSTDCPYKTPPKSLASSPGSSSSPSVQGPYLPVVRCPCGTCKVLTSKTDKNPGRKFYSCPGGCGFFEWSDDIVARFKPPMCPCDAGTCSLNIVSSGPDSGRWYFACRITKGHGACNFFQWADSEGNNMKNVQGDESRGYPAPRSLFPGNQDLIVNNEPCKQDNQSSDIEFESAMAGIVENYANTSMASPIRKDEPEIPCQEPELSLQISAATHTKSEGTPPFEPVTEDEGLTLVADSSSNDAKSDKQQGPFLQSPGEDAEHPNSVFQVPSGTKTVAENSDASKLALKTSGNCLLYFLQSMDQTQHETMLKVAEVTFDNLRHLPIDYESFSKAVREYIDCKSKLAGISESMGGDFSSDEFLDHYNDKKTHFDNISQRHVEAVSACEASENRLQSLRGEVSRARHSLLLLEKQLSSCEAETLRCKSRVDEISNLKLESERSLDAACERMEKASERDSLVEAANAALENARAQLPQ